MRPRVDDAERARTFPEETFRTLGRAGLLSLPYPEEFGGADQPYEVYLQVVEEIASVWMSVAVGVSVHSLTAYPVATFGTREQQEALLPGMLSGEQLGAYCLSEPLAGSDIASMTTRATRTDDGWSLKGTKAWISHAGHADYYTTFARTSDDGGKGLSTFIVPGDAAGLTFAEPERKMGLHCDPVAQVMFDGVPVDGARLVGERGRGHEDGPVGPRRGTPRHRRCRDRARPRPPSTPPPTTRPSASSSADASATSRASPSSSPTWRPRSPRPAPPTCTPPGSRTPAARFGKEAAVAKLIATDAAMKVTTDAVQVLGGAGYTEDAAAGPLAMKHHQSWARTQGPYDGDRRSMLGKSPGHRPWPTLAMPATEMATT